jgi:CO/xanthine dehydrogenase FAD-binding subunit
MTEALYFGETEISKAIKLLGRYGKKAVILAGGTDLVPQINCYRIKPEVLVYIGNLGLDYIREKNGRLLIGAMTSMARIAVSKLVARKAPALAQAARQAGTSAIRTVATIGGNLANASPAADLATPLLALDAKLLLRSEKGKRTVPLQDFFAGAGKTILRAGELIVEISLPPVKGRTAFLKLGRRKALTLSIVNVAVRLEMSGRKCKDARIALGSVAPTPLRCTRAEDLLKGKGPDKDLVAQCSAAAMAACNPVDDQRASAWYRRKAGTALVARALAQAAGLGEE